MNATAKEHAAESLETGIDPVYTVRDDLAFVFPPANAYERILLNHAALAQRRLILAYDVERRFFAANDPLEVFTRNRDTFKAIARHVAECERIWRNAVQALERTHRNRAKTERTQTRSLRPRTYYTEPCPPSPQSPPSALLTDQSLQPGYPALPPLSG